MERFNQGKGIHFDSNMKTSKFNNSEACADLSIYTYFLRIATHRQCVNKWCIVASNFSLNQLYAK